MSLSNPTGTTSPVTKYIEYKAKVGYQYYDKEAKKNVVMKAPLYVLPLDSLTTVKGFHDASNSSIYSNEVRFGDEELTVKAYKAGGVLGKGTWKEDIKDKVSGATFAKVLYCALISDGGKQIDLVQISFKGSASGVYIESNVENLARKGNGEILVLGHDKKVHKKGNSEWTLPTVKVSDKREDILGQCIEMDKELQAYLTDRSSSTPKDETTTNEAVQADIVNGSVEEEETEELPF